MNDCALIRSGSIALSLDYSDTPAFVLLSGNVWPGYDLLPGIAADLTECRLEPFGRDKALLVGAVTAPLIIQAVLRSSASDDAVKYYLQHFSHSHLERSQDVADFLGLARATFSKAEKRLRLELGLTPRVRGPNKGSSRG